MEKKHKITMEKKHRIMMAKSMKRQGVDYQSIERQKGEMHLENESLYARLSSDRRVGQ